MKRNIIRICAFLCALMLSVSAAAEAVISAEPTQEIQIDMLAVDHRLYELGYRDGACNGILDEITINALSNFQTANGLEATGEPNELTVAILLGENAISQSRYLAMRAEENAAMSTLADGSYGDGVVRLQEALREKGYFNGRCDGVYGEETEAAVFRFQLANGLNETGIADSALFLRLYAGKSILWEEFLQESCACVGDSGASVRRLQLWLRQKGYFTGECTGNYGDGTQQAVKRFQLDCGLEPLGDADLETCRQIYWDVNAYLHQSAALRRGETGAEVEEFCRELALLGYPAHARFNMQTELALMQFQLVNKMKVTGIADALTQARMRSENALSLQDYLPSGKEMAEDSEQSQKIARQAVSLLGQYSELDTCFGFVQYVALKCGLELLNRSQLAQQQIGAADTIEPGTFLGLQIGDKEICGIAISERSMIYRAESGYIVLGYMEAMNPDDIYLYHMIEGI